MDFVKNSLKQSCNVRNIRFRNGPKHSPCLDYARELQYTDYLLTTCRLTQFNLVYIDLSSIGYFKTVFVFKTFGNWLSFPKKSFRPIK